MITYVQGGFFTSPATVLVNTVNTVGIMGKGIAREFKAIYPEMFEIYRSACERGEFTIGTLQFYRSEHKSVLNFPTKRHWKAKSQLPDIEAGVKTFVEQYEELGIGSIAFPPLGCGNGGLDWEGQVRPLMETYLNPLPIDVYIHMYDTARDDTGYEDFDALKMWLRTTPRALRFEEIWDDLSKQVDEDPRIDHWDLAITTSRALCFHSPALTVEFARDDMLDLWQQLRSYGFLSVDDVPFIYRPAVRAFFTLLERLPYIAKSEFVTANALRSIHGESVSEGLARSTSRGIRLTTWDREISIPEQLQLAGLISAA